MDRSGEVRKVRVADLTGAQLDYWVAKAEDEYSAWIDPARGCVLALDDDHTVRFCPSTDWEQGGRIIERERISLLNEGSDWEAVLDWSTMFGERACVIGQIGPTSLIAAMRAFVFSKFGKEVVAAPPVGAD